MAFRSAILGIALLVAGTTGATERDEDALDKQFGTLISPFLKSYCVTCHGGQKKEARLDLESFATLDSVLTHHQLLEKVRQRLEDEEMPPEKAPRLPEAKARQAVVAWIRAIREREIRKNDGDPGPVPVRRLSNAEFDATIHDLTGIDLKPTREFPVDPANEAGFDNSGESLTMPPPLVKKYLLAARAIADHAVLKPTGMAFAEHPVVTDVDRDKYCVQRILKFYDRYRIDYADYFVAAWTFEHRAAFGMPTRSLKEIAIASGLSAKYLETLHSVLTEPNFELRPIGALQQAWRELPSDIEKKADVERQCKMLRDHVLAWRKEFLPPVDSMRSKGISDGSQPFVLWKNRKLASLHMSYSGGGVVLVQHEDGDDAKARKAKEVAFPKIVLFHDDPEIPRYEAAFARFCRLFPDAFYVSDRGPYFAPKDAGKGRPLTAGFHLMQGYFRDDQPLQELILDDAGRAELDALWQELNFVTLAPLRQYRDFIFFERGEPPRFATSPEFHFARSEDKDVTSAAKIDRFREVYLAKARKLGAKDETIQAIETYFTTISAEIREVEQARTNAESKQLEALVRFAERAHRRPITAKERDELLAFYRRLRETDSLDHEDAVRDALASVLLAPQFLYRVDLVAEENATQPLSDVALASRLSYFLWSSMPDNELLAHAVAGDLLKPKVLVMQTRRMLRNDRIRRLAENFAGNWLDIRRFEEHNGVDRTRFPSFTSELRTSMFEEPIRFFVDVVQNDRSVLDFLEANHTFVNSTLAKHYGMPVSSGEPGSWVRLDDADRFGRGGLLPMAVFLTKNSPGLRTSPVKRGYWVVRRVLGEEIPPPPPTVPELPADEAKTGDLSLPQLLARHRSDKSCAGCHQRFDAIGVAFEGYGPIGERRDHDLGGRPLETKATFPDGQEREGLDGLRRYLSEQRTDGFLDNLCRKMLSYALGRTLLLSDEVLVSQMRDRLKKDGYRFGGLVETIVTSPQFLQKRGRDDPHG